jgi:hypothetical protein
MPKAGYKIQTIGYIRLYISVGGKYLPMFPNLAALFFGIEVIA